MKINVDTKQIMSSFSGEEQPFYISFKMNKCFFFIIMFLLLAFAIVMIILIVNINKKGCPTKEKLGLEKQKELNERIQPLMLEKDKEIAQLGRRVTELEEEKSKKIII
jgi:large-conductance mechanosensitive channel